jgi:HAMP domain-containing protein
VIPIPFALALILAQVPGAGTPGAAVPGLVTADQSRLVSARLSNTVPELGERFDLTIIARVPPGHTVSFPDSLSTEKGVESIAPPVWSAVRVPGDSSEITIVYPFRGMTWGRREMPVIELLTRPRNAEGRSPAEGGGPPLVEPWASGMEIDPSFGSSAASAGSDPGVVSRLRLPPAWVEIPQVLPQTRPEGGFRPAPAADIVGSNWSPARIALTALFAAAGLWIVFLLAMVIWRRVAIPLTRAARLRALRQLRARRPPGVPPRQRALSELDELLGLSLDGGGSDLGEMYDRGTRAAREYLGRVRGPERLARTYRELIVDLRNGDLREGVRGDFTAAGPGDAPAPEAPGGHLAGRPASAPALEDVLARAERIRFGEAKANAAETRRDLATLREWVMNYPERESDPVEPPAGSSTAPSTAPSPVRSGRESDGVAAGAAVPDDSGRTHFP